MDTESLKILILEDSEIDAEMIQRLLRKSGLNCQFKIMMTREDYIRALVEFKPHIILSDNAMPQFSASEALEILQEHGLHIPFILVTGTVSEEFAAGIIKAGADDYLLKDRLTRLPVAIETALKQKQTEREKLEATEKLVQSEKRFRALVENNDGIIALVDKNLNSVFRSSSAAKITGWTNAEFEKVDTREYIHPDDLAAAQNVMVQALANPAVPIPFAIRARHKDGHYLSLEGVVTNLIDDPAVGGIISNLRDVTERVIAEKKILKANRLYFFISQINQMIVRTTNEATLFEEVCRIAVELGQFRMAWLGLIDEYTQKIIPVMMAGEDKEWLYKIAAVPIEDDPQESSPIGAALREGKYIICNDIEKDPRMAPWKASTSGKPYRSSMTLPVKRSGNLIGSFSVYASENNFFDDAEIALLEEAVGDLSFALENFDKETLRKNAEEAVIKSEQRYHTLAEVSPVGIFHTDADGYTTYVNPRWTQISGLSAQEAMGNGWFKAVHPEDKGPLIKGWQEATNIQDVSISEYRFIRPDGTIAWVIGHAIPERNGDNRIVGYVGTITDITDRKKAEEEIFKEKLLSDKIINSLPGIFYLSDPTPRLVRWNKEMEKISGYSKEELEKISPISLFHPEDHAILRKGIEKSYREGSADVEVRLVTKTGQVIPFYFTGAGIEYLGKPAVLGTGIDISERKKAEEEIKKSNERFVLIAEATNDGLWDWNLETNQLWGNEMHQQLYGLTVADPVPNHEEWKGRIHPEDRERTVNALEEAKSSGQKSYVDEYRFYTENKGWMNVYGRTLIEYNDAGKPVRLIGSMMDITERKKTEELLAANEKRFRKLIENGNDAFAILTPEGKALYVSSSVERVLGYTEEEIYRMNMFTLVHPDNLEEVKATMEVVMANPGVPVAGHLSRLKHKDGTWHWFEDTITNLIDDPDIGGIVDNFRDVTERVKDQMALKVNEEKNRDIVENITDILCTHDLEGNILSVNLTAKKQLGYEIEEMLRMNIQDVLLPQSKESFKGYINSIIKKGYGKGLMHVQTRSGENRIWEFRNTLRNNGIDPPFIYGFAQDVTERTKAQNEILKEKNLSDSIINSLPGIFYLYNKQGKFLRWNTNFEKVTLYKPEEIREMHPLDLFVEEEKVMLAKKISNVFTNGEDEVQANLLLKTKETIPYFFTGIAIDYEGERCLMGVGIDFSEREKAQQEIEKTTEKLRELTAHLLSVREEERKRIGREIHDELGQQLTAIKMDVSWIDKKIAEDSTPIKNKLKNIITLLDGSNQSIRRILSELRPGILDDYGLIEALEWQNRMFTSNTGIPVKFATSEKELKLPEPVATCIFRVYQEAFTNITRYANASKVTASLTIANWIIKVVVADDGKGFDTVAVQSKKSFGILGMRERVLSLNGKFTLQSSPQKGTKITISIPL